MRVSKAVMDWWPFVRGTVWYFKPDFPAHRIPIAHFIGFTLEGVDKQCMDFQRRTVGGAFSEKVVER